MSNIFNFDKKEGYIWNPRMLFCKNKNDVNRFITRSDIDILTENFSFEINVDSLIGRKFLPMNNEIDDGNIQDIYKKVYLINISDLVSSDLIYDIELVGNIYRTYVIIDDLVVMKITNQLSKNINIRIPEFTLNKPFPIGYTTFTNILIGVEMTNKYEEGNNEKIHLNLKGGHFNLYGKTSLMREQKFKINFIENKSLDLYNSHLLFMVGKCIPFIDKTIEYYL
jgi:hypothetical protein